MTSDSLRSLARSLAPLPEESLPGFLLRLAFRLDSAPGRLAQLVGLSNRQYRLPAEFLIELPEPIAEVFGAVTRLSATEVRSMTLGTFAARCRNGVSGRNHWAFTLSSRYCPACLAGDGSAIQRALGGAWRLRWHLPVSFACREHHSMLLATCPACRNPPNRPPGSERVGLVMQRS